MSKITKKVVDASHPQESDYFVWDAELRRFGLRVRTSGHKSYVVQYRCDGKVRRYTIGSHGPFTPDTARAKALQLLAEVENGADPAERRETARTAMRVTELCDLYVAQGCTTKKASTLVTDMSRIERHIKPLLGHKTVAGLTFSDIEKFVRDVTTGKTARNKKTSFRGRSIVRGGGGTAARTVGLLGGILTYAQKRGLIPNNPVRGVERRRDAKRSRFLTREEFGRLGQAFDEGVARGANKIAIAALRFLLLTGCRKSEVLTLEWSFVDWEARCLHLPTSKTGHRTIQISDAAIRLLEAHPRIEGCRFVFPGADGEKPFSGLHDVWESIRKDAGIPDVRIHDLRRSFGSFAAQQGFGLLAIGKILGHADPKTTQIYAHLTDEGIRSVANVAADGIERALAR